MSNNKKLIPLEEVAELYSFSLKTLRRWASERKFPLYKVSNIIRVSPVEFEEWLDLSKVNPRNGGES